VDETVAVGALEPLPETVARSPLAVNLHGRGPESTRVLLASRPERLIAFAHRAVAETAGFPRWRPDEHEVGRWCRLLTECDIPADPSRLPIDVPGEARVVAAGCTIVHPGAASPARRWPSDRWAAVARRERAAGRRVLLTGTHEERPLCLRIAAVAGVHLGDVVAGRTSVLELARLVRDAGLVLSGDTGVGHLATAFGAPSVVLFGPTPPSEWGPPASDGRHRALWAGRRGDAYAAAPDPDLLAITPERVASEIDDLRSQLAA
jgi:ADP-heptose:LPS heptosyltransferase